MKAFAFALVLLCCAMPMKADTFTPVGILATFGNSNPGMESFSSSFQFDRTTQTVVNGSVLTSTSGPAGLFVFDTYTISGSTNLLYSFLWDNATGNTIDYLIGNDPVPGTEIIRFISEVQISGPGGWSTLSAHPTNDAILYPLADTPVPEPPTLLLLLASIGGIALFFRKRLAGLTTSLTNC